MLKKAIAAVIGVSVIAYMPHAIAVEPADKGEVKKWQPKTPRVQMKPGGTVMEAPKPGGHVMEAPKPGGSVMERPKPGGSVMESPRPGGTVMESPRPGGSVMEAPRPGGSVMETPIPGGVNKLPVGSENQIQKRIGPGPVA